MKIGKFKISTAWVVIIIIILLVVGYFASKQLFKDPLASYTLEKVSNGEVVQEVSETGSIRTAEKISLGFKSMGRIEKIYVNVGDEVKQGQEIAALDNRDIVLQLRGAEGGAEISLENAERNLEDTKKTATENINKAYKDAMESLDDANLKIYNAFNFVDLLKTTYFERGDNESIIVSDNVAKISLDFEKFKILVGIIKKSGIEESISSDLDQVNSYVGDIKNSLEQIRNATSPLGPYQSIVSSANLTELDAHKANLNTVYFAIVSESQNIKTVLATNATLFNSAESQVNTVKTQIDPLNLKIQESVVRSISAGKVIEISKRVGEVVQPGEQVISFLPSSPFQVKANIYEQDIVNVKVGDAVKINLVAFPKQTFDGKVIFINPGEKIVDNVVYYEVTIDFAQQPESIRSGMTADIVVLTNKKEKVVRVPKNAVLNIGEKEIIRVAKNGKIEDREVITGLEGNDYFEIISGLKEGEDIVL